ncbi:MAG: hypothetical protein KatS3mg042_0236 [Rhodothermaceae bacterium]|nr:MAG: hypothetical protein KatS3mg042_0236 [Rhodothermaceae bacterium]
MKKFLSLLSALVLVVAMTGCTDTLTGVGGGDRPQQRRRRYWRR